ncbi:hypothetical protein Tco_0755088 [Tanacetum coccineum]
MKQDKEKQAALDEKLVPAVERVKIGLSNLRIDPTIYQREDTFQVALDILKHTLFYNAFLISADVPEIYMQQFWASIHKLKRSSLYEFEIDQKTCQIDAEVFRKILDISYRVENQEFTDPPTIEELKKFVLKLGYSGNISTVTEMYAHHMHQPWRTFGAIINKCLSGKTMANDKLRQSRLEILWVRRRELIPYPRFMKVIIQHFMLKHKSISKRKGSQYHITKQDRLLERLKFISKGEKFQVYGAPIPDNLLTDDIKDTKAYKMFHMYSTGEIAPKMSQGRAVKKDISEKPTEPKKLKNVCST